MNNPWEEISLDDYENHMSLDSVKQLQEMNSIMREQFASYPTDTAMILGIAGGNGLEHVDCDKYRRVYGVDINEGYLKAAAQRYQKLSEVLECLKLDLINEAEKLPRAGLLIANLLIEYIGFECFGNVVKQVCPKYISCVTQYDTGEGFVSDSPYLHSFDGLDSIHRSIDPDKLKECLTALGYSGFHSERYPLPNGKMLIRTDCGSNDTAK